VKTASSEVAAQTDADAGTGYALADFEVSDATRRPDRKEGRRRS
jgi:hypothetical protein